MKCSHALAATVAACALLAGCTAQHNSSPGSASSPSPVGSEITPSNTASAHPSHTAVTDLKDWPTKPVTVDEMPHGKLLSTTFGKGYTGSEFINRLAKQWHITLGPRKKNDFNKKDDVPPVWLAAGTGHSSTKATTDVTAVWELSGDLASLTCSVSRKVPDYKDFLRDCAKLNYPGAQPTVATRWLKRTMPSLDKAHTQAKKPVGSPLYRSGQAASYLYEYDNGAEGTVDMLRIFGAAS